MYKVITKDFYHERHYYIETNNLNILRQSINSIRWDEKIVYIEKIKSK